MIRMPALVSGESGEQQIRTRQRQCDVTRITADIFFQGKNSTGEVLFQPAIPAEFFIMEFFRRVRFPQPVWCFAGAVPGCQWVLFPYFCQVIVVPVTGCSQRQLLNHCDTAARFPVPGAACGSVMSTPCWPSVVIIDWKRVVCQVAFTAKWCP